MPEGLANPFMEIKKAIAFLLCIPTVSLSGCSLLPGMQGVNIAGMRKIEYKPDVQINPTVVPINAALVIHHPLPPYIYLIEPQDILSISVWQHPEFNPPPQQTSTASSQQAQAAGIPGYLVDHTGRIYFPLAGYVDVRGKTADEVRVEITARLRKYVKNPQVLVRVADYRSKKIYVFGEINRPGLLPLNDQFMSITDAITLAGSFDRDTADPRHVYVIRGNILCPTIYWLSANTADTLLLAEKFQLQPNDIVYVSSAIVTRWNRFLSQLLPSLSTVFLTKTITGK